MFNQKTVDLSKYWLERRISDSSDDVKVLPSDYKRTKYVHLGQEPRDIILISYTHVSEKGKTILEIYTRKEDKKFPEISV